MPAPHAITRHRHLTFRCSYALICAAVVVFMFALRSPAQTDPQQDAYAKAVSLPRTGDRIAALDKFIAGARGTALEVDALELLVWDRLRTGDPAGAGRTADRLAVVEPDNALAMAVLAGAANQDSSRLEMATRGLAAVPRLRQPRGMAASEFSTLKLRITAMLNGAAGLGSLGARDYGSARQFLHQAISYFPDNTEYVYALGLADLSGTAPDASEGYWYLARAVILTRGTPASQQISQYAYNRYLQDGGTRDDWSRFLLAATASAPTTPAAQVRQASAPSPSVAAAVASSPAVRQPVETKPARKAARAGTTSRTRATTAKTQPKREAKNPKREAKNNDKKAEPDLGQIAEEADLARSAPPPPRPSPKLRSMPHPGAPVSIGILIGSAPSSKARRNAMLDGLSDLVRHLRPGDEAFIMSFSDQLDFEQDLTGNYHLLEQAMEHVPPHSGSALYDAVAFAAGHLRRISRNSNRVLLVISDGRNGNSHTSPFQLESEINGIRIDCIGTDVGGGDARYLLSALASHTGGQAQFVSDAHQFQAATQDLAQALGLGGPF